MKDVHQLPLILMETFYLYIEDRIWIYIDTVVLLDVFGQTHLVLVLDLPEFLLCFLIIHPFL